MTRSEINRRYRAKNRDKLNEIARTRYNADWRRKQPSRQKENRRDELLAYRAKNLARVRSLNAASARRAIEQLKPHYLRQIAKRIGCDSIEILRSRLEIKRARQFLGLSAISALCKP